MAMTISYRTAIPTRQTLLAAIFAVAMALGTTVFFAPAPANADRRATSAEIDSWKACYDKLTGTETPTEADQDCCLMNNMKWVGGYPGGHCDVSTIVEELSPPTASTKPGVPAPAPMTPPRSQR
jgi:hypothetical protein